MPLHSYFPTLCWVRHVLTLDINNVAQEEEEAMKMLLVLGVHNPQSLPVMFGAFVSRIKRNTMIIFLFLYVILFLYTLICHYMHETWSWYTYRFALGFLWKNRCDSLCRYRYGFPKVSGSRCECHYLWDKAKHTLVTLSSAVSWCIKCDALWTVKVIYGWGPCVVRGPVDGRFLVWWVIDNVVWTDSWLSIAGAGCSLTRVGACEEQGRKVVAGEASRCGEDK
jgi:hypothetical protein